MTKDFDDGGPAFPREDYQTDRALGQRGMSLRDWFAGHALSNAAICTGSAPEWQLRIWFGDLGGIKSSQIAAKQAFYYADQMIAERSKRMGP